MSDPLERRVTGPMARGALLALSAAVAFGATTPAVKALSEGAGAFPTATLLYAGSMLATLVPASTREAPLGSRHVPRLVIVAVIGAVIAPVCLAVGLSSTGGAASSLLLNFETVFTAILGWRLYREHVGRRFALVVAMMVAGGACLVVSREGATGSLGWGAVAIVAAACAWAVDSALTRPLADVDPVKVTRYKGAIGATVTLAASLVTGSPFPRATAAAGLLLAGLLGYGVSLRFYLGAQRIIGAGRTGTIFGTAPFVGALVAWAMGDTGVGLGTAGAAALMGSALVFQATEKHAHAHTHEAVEHEHLHRHDDGHHDHAHEPPFEGEHSHAHRHEPTTHDHAHGADLHHQHH